MVIICYQLYKINVVKPLEHNDQREEKHLTDQLEKSFYLP
ncbi:hypothetical protein A33Q_3495 [Indibacter alkaliphilus LW1]|uniref:Uncharacterized protein n=1 Tax=Indibacter alkaliphilus (strain CCUG 57479 / KCTC 22604 / LW1) TaxID=1189612 RepID=S2D3U8_INDAL|nr:hypothetical protein A33Q_3489 [Indibacter alkaliphilus LW1]EOZ93549.1 hypothetical protein A33Q_3495 [Indibacter alkaliphilus LW1]